MTIPGLNMEEFPYLVITVIIAFTVHEFAHAFVATKFGDPTPKNQGRLTLNPVAHIDLLGLLMIILAGLGWAKPVQVNYSWFKNPRLAGILTTIAGPLSNFFMAFVAAIIYMVMLKSGDYQLDHRLEMFFEVFISTNIVLMIFNLIPIPPLDGYRIVSDLMPNNKRHILEPLEKYGMFIFLAIVLIKPLNEVIIKPIFSTFMPVVSNFIFDILSPIIM